MKLLLKKCSRAPSPIHASNERCNVLVPFVSCYFKTTNAVLKAGAASLQVIVELNPCCLHSSIWMFAAVSKALWA